jgi:hypothetical protein
MIKMRAGLVGCILLVVLVCGSVPHFSEATDPRIQSAEAFTAAREAGDLETARSYLGSDPRFWYDSREGVGDPMQVEEGGRWAAWDAEFRSAGEIIQWEVDSDWVASIHSEMNDYFRLIERNGAWYRKTWFFGPDGKIEGAMISGWEDAPRTKDMGDEFAKWAAATRPAEWDYLRPGGSLDPTDDRAERTRKLLNTWRKDVGLPHLK